jgi:Cu/Ag efflux pump CusA
MEFLKTRYSNGRSLGPFIIAFHCLGRERCLFALSLYLMSSVIGSEFLPHLDEGAMWVRGTLAPSTGPEESLAISNKARIDSGQLP